MIPAVIFYKNIAFSASVCLNDLNPFKREPFSLKILVSSKSVSGLSQFLLAPYFPTATSLFEPPRLPFKTNRSTASAIAPSPVTLHPVPRLSCAI